MGGWIGDRDKPIFERRIAHLVRDGTHYWLDVQLCSDHLLWITRRWDRVQPVRIDRGHLSWWGALRSDYTGELAMGFLKRASEMDAQKAQKRSGDDLKWATAHPALNEYLTLDKYPDGGQRQTATLLIFQEGLEWKACLRDRDTARTLWCSAASVPELLEALDEILQSDDAQWRKDRQSGSPQNKKRG